MPPRDLEDTSMRRTKGKYLFDRLEDTTCHHAQGLAYEAGLAHEGVKNRLDESSHCFRWFVFTRLQIRACDQTLINKCDVQLRADVVPRTAENFRALCTGMF